MSQVKIPIKDYSNEKSTVSVHVDSVTPPDDISITAWFNAVDGVSIGTLEKSVLVSSVDKDVGSTATPASAFAQRELKWLCKYTDDVTLKAYRFEIPCADASLLTGNTDMLPLGAGAGATFKTQFETIAVSELGNSVTLNSVELVGRSG